jgi:hypothetical protein
VPSRGTTGASGISARCSSRGWRRQPAQITGVTRRDQLAKDEDAPAEASSVLGEVGTTGVVADLPDLSRFGVMRVVSEPMRDVEPLAGRITVPLFGRGQDHLDEVEVERHESLQRTGHVGETLTAAFQPVASGFRWFLSPIGLTDEEPASWRQPSAHETECPGRSSADPARSEAAHDVEASLDARWVPGIRLDKADLACHAERVRPFARIRQERWRDSTPRPRAPKRCANSASSAPLPQARSSTVVPGPTPHISPRSSTLDEEIGFMTQCIASEISWTARDRPSPSRSARRSDGRSQEPLWVQRSRADQVID